MPNVRSTRPATISGEKSRASRSGPCGGFRSIAFPPTDYTIGIDTIDVMVAKLQEFAGWPIYKIKLGTPHDLDIVRALRQHTDAVFRVDANCGWTAAETVALCLGASRTWASSSSSNRCRPTTGTAWPQVFERSATAGYRR